MKRPLPIAGVRSTVGAAAVTSDAVMLPGRSVVILPARSTDGAGTTLAPWREAAANLERKVVSVVASPADEGLQARAVREGEWVLAGEPALVAGALPSLQMDEHDVLLLHGLPFGVMRASLSVLVTGGVPSSAWDGAARAFKDRVDLVVETVSVGMARDLLSAIFGA